MERLARDEYEINYWILGSTKKKNTASFECRPLVDESTYFALVFELANLWVYAGQRRPPLREG